MHSSTAGRWQSGAMTKPVSRDAKLKGPKESTGRALVNCTSGKYRSSPIKLMSLDMSLEHWCLAKFMPLQVLQRSIAASKVRSLGASARLFLSCMRMEKVGSEIALRQIPARPICAAGSYLHAKLAWHLGTMYRVPGICISIEARSLVDNAPTWSKQSSELF